MQNLKSHKTGLRASSIEHRASSIEHRASSSGFSMTELLIALAITALIITAVAVAFNASVTNFKVNDASFKALNRARQTLALITPRIRTAQAVDSASPLNTCSFITDTGEDITYRFESSVRKLYLDKDSNSYLLCDNVDAMTFTKSIDPTGMYVKSVLISITVHSGSAQQTLSTAVTVRKNLQ